MPDAWALGTYGIAVRKLLTDHLALVLSTLAATTVVAKIWTVTHGGLAGIAALVSSGGLTSLVGALLAGLPAVGTACMLAAVVFVPEAIREGDDLRGPIVGTLASLSIGFALAPVLWFLVGLALFVVTTVTSLLIVGARRYWTQSSTRQLPFMLRKSVMPQHVPPVATLALIAMFGWVAVATSDRPWLPPEDVTTTQSETITGYVLDDSSGLLLMKESDRSILRLPEDEVLQRTICRTDARSAQSLMSKVVWSVDIAYPKCSEN